MSSTAPQERRLGIVARVGGWAAGHRRLVLLGWIVALVGAFGASSAVGTNYGNSFSLKGTDSQRAVDLLKRNFPAQSGDSDQIVLHARSGSVTAAAVQARVAPVLEQIARLPHVSGVVSPYSPAGSAGGLARRTDRVRDRELRPACERPAEGGRRTGDLARRQRPVSRSWKSSSAARRSSRSKKSRSGRRPPSD